jgi:hypothetical protein
MPNMLDSQAVVLVPRGPGEGPVRNRSRLVGDGTRLVTARSVGCGGDAEGGRVRLGGSAAARPTSVRKNVEPPPASSPASSPHSTDRARGPASRRSEARRRMSIRRWRSRVSSSVLESSAGGRGERCGMGIRIAAPREDPPGDSSDDGSRGGLPAASCRFRRALLPVSTERGRPTSPMWLALMWLGASGRGVGRYAAPAEWLAFALNGRLSRCVYVEAGAAGWAAPKILGSCRGDGSGGNTSISDDTGICNPSLDRRTEGTKEDPIRPCIPCIYPC